MPVRQRAAWDGKFPNRYYFYFQNPLYKSRVGGKHTYTPARHVVALTHGVELDTAFFGSRNIEDTDRLMVQNEAVWVVVYNDDVVAAGKVDQLSYNSIVAFAPVGMLG